MLLEDRVAIVSGVGPGLGRDLAVRFATHGAHVVLGARTEATLAAVAEEVEALGRKAVHRRTDTTDRGDCDALVAAAVETFGRVDALVQNAFVQPPLRRIEDDDVGTWRGAFEVNVLGAVQMAQAVIPAMRERHAGSIVAVASMSARRTNERFGAYAATKSALIATVRTLAKEHGRDGIRANALVPGYVWGPNLEAWFDHRARKRGVDPQVVYDEVAAETCLGRIPTGEEVADGAVFLCSDLAAMVTGQSLDVNAGHWFH